jgi:hypothetical protein
MLRGSNRPYLLNRLLCSDQHSLGRGEVGGNVQVHLGGQFGTVEGALCATGYGPLRAIEVTVHARLVILGGRVPSYYLKQVAQTTALAVPGARQIRNDLDVSQPS